MSAEWVSVGVQIMLALASAMAIAITFYVNSTTQKKASSLEKTIAGVEKAGATALDNALSKIYGVINEYGNRIQRLETMLDNLPHSKDVHQIALQCTELVGELKELRAELAAVRDTSKANQGTLVRLEGYLRRSEARNEE